MSRPGRHVLLVDDESLFLSSLKDGLARHFTHVTFHTAENGAVAVEMLGRLPVDLVITDLKMPVLDGFAVLAEMNRNHRHVPAIVMSAFGTAATEQRVLDAGAVYCIDKPIDLNTLVSRVGVLLSPRPVGGLQGVSLAAFLQLLAMERQSGVVHVRWAAGVTRLHLHAGALVHAEDGTHEGLDVALRTVALEHVEIELRAEARPIKHTIDTPLTQLLLEAARLRDEVAPDAGIEDLDFDLIDVQPLDDEPTARPTPVALPNTQPTGNDTRNAVKKMLDAAMQIGGAIGVALVDYQSGMTLGTAGPGLNVELAAAGNTNVVRAKMKTMASLGIEDKIEDILITLDTQYHLIRMTKQPNMFLYIALNREDTNLGMARYGLAKIETEFAM